MPKISHYKQQILAQNKSLVYQLSSERQRRQARCNAHFYRWMGSYNNLKNIRAQSATHATRTCYQMYMQELPRR